MVNWLINIGIPILRLIKVNIKVNIGYCHGLRLIKVNIGLIPYVD